MASATDPHRRGLISISQYRHRRARGRDRATQDQSRATLANVQTSSHRSHWMWTRGNRCHADARPAARCSIVTPESKRLATAVSSSFQSLVVHLRQIHVRVRADRDHRLLQPRQIGPVHQAEQSLLVRCECEVKRGVHNLVPLRLAAAQRHLFQPLQEGGERLCGSSGEDLFPVMAQQVRESRRELPLPSRERRADQRRTHIEGRRHPRLEST